MPRTSKRKSQRGASSSSAQPVSYRETTAMIEMQEALERARKKGRAAPAAAASDEPFWFASGFGDDAGDLQARASPSEPELSRQEAFKQRWMRRMAGECSEGAAAAAPAASASSAFKIDFASAVKGFKCITKFRPETLLTPFFDKSFESLAMDAPDADTLSHLVNFRRLWVQCDLAICRKCYEPCTKTNSDELGLFVCRGCVNLVAAEQQVAEAVLPLQQEINDRKAEINRMLAEDEQARARWREEQLEASKQDKIELEQFRQKIAESSRLHELDMEKLRQLRQLIEPSQLQGPSQAVEPSESEPEQEQFRLLHERATQLHENEMEKLRQIVHRNAEALQDPEPGSDVPAPMDEGEDASSISSQEVQPFVPPMIGLASNEPSMSQQSAASSSVSAPAAAAAADGSYRCVKCKCRIPLNVSSLFNAKRRKAKVCLLCPIPK